MTTIICSSCLLQKVKDESVRGCKCKLLRSWSLDPPLNGPRLVLSESYQHELFFQYFRCCSSYTRSTSSYVLSLLPPEIEKSLTLTFLKKTVLTDSFIRFIRRFGHCFKTQALIGAALKKNWREEFYERLSGLPHNEVLPILTETSNHVKLIKTVRQMEFVNNTPYFNYKRKMLWSTLRDAETFSFSVDHSFKLAKKTK